ncbi:hypothetical protein QFZ43_002063 [Streptomyces afghaniensis]|nr:hypothetical protein [Streptomyces afghaniensis]
MIQAGGCGAAAGSVVLGLLAGSVTITGSESLSG